MDLFLVVMAGGSGTRFWPKSTSRRPKQLLSFGGASSQSLLRETVSRFDGLVKPSNQLVVTTQALAAAIQEQLPAVQVLAEPQGRNTAPCIYWAARAVAERNPEAVMLVMPSDHYIPRPDAFRATVNQAAGWAATHEDLVALGVRPTRPETGYGYLKMGPQLAGSQGAGYRVEAFVEKPGIEKAREYLESGRFLWNGGMFLWRASVILKAFDRLMPEMKQAWELAKGRVPEAYPLMTATSIDYGVMEKAPNVVTFPIDCGWDDLGSWTSLESLAQVLGTVQPSGVVSAGDVIAVDSQANIVDVPGKLVALLGVRDLIVVEHGGALLVAQKERAQDIRLIVDQVKKQRPELA